MKHSILFERLKRFVTTLNEGSYAMGGGNLESILLILGTNYPKLKVKKIGSNCILKERRLNFSTEGTFRPVLETAPYLSWWSLLDKVRTCIQQNLNKV